MWKLFDRRTKVEVCFGIYAEEWKTGRLVGLVRGDFQDTSAYPGKVMIPSTMVVVDFGKGEPLQEFALHRVRLK